MEKAPGTGSSSTRAKNKYYKAHYDALRVSAMKGKKVFYERAAREVRSERQPLNGFIIEAIEEKMKRETPGIFEEMERETQKAEPEGAE